MLTVRQAQDKLIENTSGIKDSQRVMLLQAQSRVLAEDIYSEIAVPNTDNSSMDGYCFRFEDYEQFHSLKVSQRIAAGHIGERLEKAQAARIFTGAALPEGADTVIRQEWCDVRENTLFFNTKPQKYDCVRKKGEDIALGSCVLSAGTRLSAQHIGQAASIGLTSLPVVRRPRVALICSGDELKLPGESLLAGQIYNSNRYTLHLLLENAGCEVLDLGIVRDDFNQTVQMLRYAAKKCDFIISSGGVSVGEEDHIKPAIESVGTVDFWKIAVKPGKPLVYGHITDQVPIPVPMIGLPGNPVSSFITFLLFVRPCLLKLQNAEQLWPRPMRVQMAKAYEHADERNEFLRVKIDKNGRAICFDNQSSGVLSSLSWADGLVDNPPGHVIQADEWVNYYPINSFFA